MPYHSSLAIANEFLDRSQQSGGNLTHMQVQKLVFLAHGWGMAVTGRPLIEDEVEAWEFGPVIRKLYDALRTSGRNPIRKRIRWGDDTPFPSDDGDVARADLEANEVEVIDRIWDVYGRFPAFKLSALTHANNSPWHKTYEPGGRNKIIPAETIADYFADLAAQE